MDSQQHFDSWVENTIARSSALDCADFSQFISTLPGIYPETALISLRALAAKTPEFTTRILSLIESASHERTHDPSPSSLLGLPPPHPLDFEWRFSPAAIHTISGAARALHSESFGSLALVGTPTFAVTRGSTLQQFKIDYYGLDIEILTASGNVAHLNDIRSTNLLRAQSIERTYDVVIMDPPWYSEHVHRFLHFAAHALKVGGHLLLAMPAIGTRPGIELENIFAKKWASDLGLEVKNISYGAVPYETPPFERNALRASGISNVSVEWRRGDLWTLQKMSALNPEWPGDISDTRWEEIRFGQVRVRIDTSARVLSPDPSLKSLVEGDVLPTVSRRDLRRHEARIWTTGNRIFACDNPVFFAELTKRWVNENQVRDPADDMERIRRRLLDAVKLEQSELSWTG